MKTLSRTDQLACAWPPANGPTDRWSTIVPELRPDSSFLHGANFSNHFLFSNNRKVPDSSLEQADCSSVVLSRVDTQSAKEEWSRSHRRNIGWVDRWTNKFIWFSQQIFLLVHFWCDRIVRQATRSIWFVGSQKTLTWSLDKKFKTACLSSFYIALWIGCSVFKWC